jgi:hypothetical protein
VDGRVIAPASGAGDWASTELGRVSMTTQKDDDVGVLASRGRCLVVLKQLFEEGMPRSQCAIALIVRGSDCSDAAGPRPLVNSG